MLDIAIAPSASVHALVGSSLPGAVPPFAPVATAAPALGLDAELIVLAERVKALAHRDHRIWDRRAAIEDTVDAVLPAHDAVADRERLEAEMEARLGYPRWEKLSKRTFARLVRWAMRLAAMQPQTQAGLSAKIDVRSVLADTGNAGDWTTAFAAAVRCDRARMASAAAAAQHPDAELLALAPAWAAVVARCGATAAAFDAAAERLQALAGPIPEALFRLDSDHRRLGPYGSEHLPTGRRWYGDPASIEAFRQGCPADAGTERLAEVLAAYDGWQAAARNAEAITGYAAAHAADDEAARANGALRSKILATPARTLDGVMFKARVARWCFGSTEDEIAQQLAEEVADGPATGETAAFSILLDLARMIPDAGRALVPHAVERAVA